MEGKELSDFLDIAKQICKKTIGYSLDRIKLNPDGTTTHIHSEEFLDNHPDRKDTPEFTKEEEQDEVEYIAKLAQIL